MCGHSICVLSTYSLKSPRFPVLDLFLAVVHGIPYMLYQDEGTEMGKL